MIAANLAEIHGDKIASTNRVREASRRMCQSLETLPY